MRVVLLLAILASAVRADPSDTACERDDDCTTSTFAGCCTACPVPPKAWSKKGLQIQTNFCGIVDCAAPQAPKGGCPKVPKQTRKAAKCVHQACVSD